MPRTAIVILSPTRRRVKHTRACRAAVCASIMFKWASRITLEITEIRVQRLQEISEEDAEQEGIIRNEQHNAIYWFEVFGEYHGHTQSVTRKEAYQKLWDSINGKKHPWSTSPYVWVLTFKRV